MRFFRMLILMVALFPSLACAAIEPDQFTQGLPLITDGRDAVYEIELPLAVYRGVARRDLGDLRVFNAAGHSVPYSLRRPANRTLREELVQSNLAFFPLPETMSESDDLSIRVDRNAKGTLVRINSSNSIPVSSNPTRAYLIDASSLKEPIKTLELKWRGAEEFLAEMAIETSEDLTHWKLLKKAAIARLAWKDERLEQNRIQLSKKNGKYLRLRWQGGQLPKAELQEVRVLVSMTHTIHKPATKHLQLAGLLISDHRYGYDLGGPLPVSKVGILLDEKNSLVRLQLRTGRPTKPETLQRRWSGMAYNLTRNGKKLISAPIALAPWPESYFEIRLDERDSPLSAAPRLDFAWQPARLIFLAQGDGPYILAFGNPRVQPDESQLEVLLKLAPKSPPRLAETGKIYSLRNKPVPAPLPWRSYMLWLILGAGVVLIGAMSWSLYRKLNEGNT